MTAKERTNRRELIIETASVLFVKQGYTQTSVREIADRVGCTEAALYYHFKDGKRELLQHVIERQFPNMDSVVQACKRAQSLRELVLVYGEALIQIAPRYVSKLRWLLSEFHNFTDEERAFIQQKQLRFQGDMSRLIAQFVPSQEEANALAWVLITSAFGYGQFFINFDLRAHTDFPASQFIEVLAHLLTCDQK